MEFSHVKKKDKISNVFLRQLGKRIQVIRKEKKLTQLDLGFMCDMERSNIARIEVGGTNPSILTLKKIAEALEVSLEELIKIE